MFSFEECNFDLKKAFWNFFTVREVDEVYILVFLLKSVAGIAAGVQDQGTQAENSDSVHC
jgi:hypothetical protein